ncbi:MAG: hypothetical protein ACREDR_02540 [Blastocatellia bacterium]
MAEESEKVSTGLEGTRWVTVIPELYYDLICRVPAGAYLIVGLLTLLGVEVGRGLESFRDSSWPVIVGTAILFVGASYVVGILLTPIGHGAGHLLLNPHIWTRIASESNYPQMIKTFVDMQNHGTQTARRSKEAVEGQEAVVPAFEKNKLARWRFIFLWHRDDPNRILYRFISLYVMSRSEHARLILPKMMAEAALCNHLMAASLVWMTCFCALRGFGIFSAVDRRSVAVGAAVLVFSTVASSYRFSQMVRRQLAFLAVIVAEEAHKRR